MLMNVTNFGNTSNLLKMHSNENDDKSWAQLTEEALITYLNIHKAKPR